MGKKLNNPELMWIYLANTVREKERLSEPGNPPSELVAQRGDVSLNKRNA